MHGVPIRPAAVFRLFAATVALFLLIYPLQGASAQAQDPDQPLSHEQLEQLVAPIALHPDSLLSQILMASTYPLEVVQAQRWVKANPGTAGDKL